MTPATHPTTILVPATAIGATELWTDDPVSWKMNVRYCVNMFMPPSSTRAIKGPTLMSGFRRAREKRIWQKPPFSLAFVFCSFLATISANSYV